MKRLVWKAFQNVVELGVLIWFLFYGGPDIILPIVLVVNWTYTLLGIGSLIIAILMHLISIATLPDKELDEYKEKIINSSKLSLLKKFIYYTTSILHMGILVGIIYSTAKIQGLVLLVLWLIALVLGRFFKNLINSEEKKNEKN